ncbi:hypothetical protein L2E82_50509 [Cichorium intybus]|nr:hypothetical protein L2E82_50509 [Cichorium intybus]
MLQVMEVLSGKKTSCDESPYAMMVSVHEHRLTENDGADLATLPSPSLALDWDNSIKYNIKKTELKE